MVHRKVFGIVLALGVVLSGCLRVDSEQQDGAASSSAENVAGNEVNASAPADPAATNGADAATDGTDAATVDGADATEDSTAKNDADPATTDSANTATDSAETNGAESSVPKGLEKFYNQEINWVACEGSNDECAEIEVPLNYEDPNGKTIKIALRKRKAESGKAIGSLFVNPGGPGMPGTAMLDNADAYFSQDLRNAYDIIGFDPRGVGKSTAIDCLDDKALGEFLDKSYDFSTADQLDQANADEKAFADGCKEKSGDLLEFVGTEQAARDMDVMRHLVGDAKINYFGLSYGTTLGATYADLFPKNVGRMALDGADDASASPMEYQYRQIMGFENALTNYLQDCVGSGQCILGDNVDDARQNVAKLIEAAQANPFPTANSGRKLAAAQLERGIIYTLYNDANWPYLTEAFERLINGNDGSAFLAFNDAYYGRDGDTFQNNSVEAQVAINCADAASGGAESATSDKDEEYLEKLQQDVTVFAQARGPNPSCEDLTDKPRKALKTPQAKGSAPIVVVGTRHDPATPYEGAVKLHKNLDNSVLVTWEGEGHVAYGRAGDCITKAVDAYLVEGTVPGDGLTCPAS